MNCCGGAPAWAPWPSRPRRCARLPGNDGPIAPGASALTAAELPLLPLLATHLSLPEIAAELALSPNTVKSHTASVYRKLMANSRRQAVARSRELALLDG